MKEWWNRLVLRQKFAAVGTGALFVLLLVWYKLIELSNPHHKTNQ